MSTTVIESVELSRNLPDRMRLDVHAKLYHLSGNARPYFSVTADLLNLRYKGDRRYEACGCLHEDVLKHFPKLAPLVDLHLSDDDGTPMHAVANGGYFLGFTKYTESNGKPLPDFAVFARLWRCTEAEARAARDFALSYEDGPQAAMELLAAICAPRWQAEATAGIELIRELRAAKENADA